METPALLYYCEDPPIDRTKHHPLLNVVFIAICAVVSGAERWDDIETFEVNAGYPLA